MSNKYRHLAHNTAIIAIGSFGSKVLSFLIVPLYTYTLSTSEYGIVDLFTTTMSLMIPFTTVLMQEAIIRFLAANEYDEKTVLNNSFFVFILGSVIVTLVLPVLQNWFPFKEYMWYFIAFVVIGGYNRVFGENLRATGKIIQYSIYGVLSTFSLVSLNIVFLLLLRTGVVGYFRALVITEIICAIYITIAGRIIKKISVTSIDFLIMKDMLKYSIPLIPNNIMWWIMNAGDKYIINFFLGNDANGLYSLSMKIPTILSVMFTIFIQAWQLSAIEENNKKGQEEFYSRIFSIVVVFLMIIATISILMTKPIFSVAIDPSFYNAWKYVPVLCVATVFNCLATFCGITYMVTKTSIKAFTTTLIGAVINLAFNFILIQFIGLFGIAVGTGLGYIVVFLMRMRDTKKVIGMHFQIKKLLIGSIILSSLAVGILFCSGYIYWLWGIVVMGIIILLYRDSMILLLKGCSQIIKRKKNKLDRQD